MVSSYLEAPLRTEAEVLAAGARRRNLRILGEAAGAYEYQASVSENGGSTANAHKFKNRAYAIRWALRQLDPMTEGPRQVLEAIAGAMKPAAE